MQGDRRAAGALSGLSRTNAAKPAAEESAVFVSKAVAALLSSGLRSFDWVGVHYAVYQLYKFSCTSCDVI